MALTGPGANGRITCTTARSATPRIFSLILVFTALFLPSSALRYVPGSPCADTCSLDKVGNIEQDVVCLDDDYNTTPGSFVRDCTTCLLNSTAVDTSTNQSDVLWALWNLRYTISECMFAYPKEIVSISSPCQVTCGLVRNATIYGITAGGGNSTADISPGLDFCNQNGFSDVAINNCAFCYSFIPQQLFLANFLQALHIACRQNPVAGQSFYPNGQAIFNESAIAGPSPPSSNNGGSSGLTGWKLALVIALPIVGGTVLFAGFCFCCFRFTRKRRQKMAATGRMNRVHDGMAATGGTSLTGSPVVDRSPHAKFDWPVTQQELSPEMAAYEHDVRAGKQPSPGYPQGRWSHGESLHSTPGNSAFPQHVRDDIGPGESQTKDPYLHEQYFGVAHGGAESVPGSAFYGQFPQESIRPGQRLSWQ